MHYYDYNKILSYNVPINIIIGERGVGKSYGIKDYSFAIVACILYATTDEIHQCFVPGRACKALDVLIDSLGSCTGVFLLSLFK